MGVTRSHASAPRGPDGGSLALLSLASMFLIDQPLGSLGGRSHDLFFIPSLFTNHIFLTLKITAVHGYVSTRQLELTRIHGLVFFILAWILRSWKLPLPARRVFLCMFDTAFSNSSFGAQGLNVKLNAQPGWAALLTGAALMLACTWNGNGLCYPSSKEFLVLSLHEMDCLWGDNVCSIPF